MVIIGYLMVNINYEMKIICNGKYKLRFVIINYIIIVLKSTSNYTLCNINY